MNNETSMPVAGTSTLSQLAQANGLVLERHAISQQRPTSTNGEGHTTSVSEHRCLVTTSSKRVGELIFKEDAVSAALNSSEAHIRCDWCLRRGDDKYSDDRQPLRLRRCGKTKSVYYRSASEQKNAWRAYFKQESDARMRMTSISQLLKNEDGEDYNSTLPHPRVNVPHAIPGAAFLVIARLLWRSHNEGRTDDLFGVRELVSHWKDLPDETKLAYAQSAMRLRTFMDEHFDGETACSLDLINMSLDSDSDEEEDGSEIVTNNHNGNGDNRSTSLINGFPSSSWLPSVKDIAILFAILAVNGYTITDYEYADIGIGIFPLASMINHSNNPNCCQYFNGRELQLRAIRDISSGEELVISYVDLATDLVSRRELLLNQYYFDICVDNVRDTQQRRTTTTSTSTTATTQELNSAQVRMEEIHDDDGDDDDGDDNESSKPSQDVSVIHCEGEIQIRDYGSNLEKHIALLSLTCKDHTREKSLTDVTGPNSLDSFGLAAVNESEVSGLGVCGSLEEENGSQNVKTKSDELIPVTVYVWNNSHGKTRTENDDCQTNDAVRRDLYDLAKLAASCVQMMTRLRKSVDKYDRLDKYAAELRNGIHDEIKAGDQLILTLTSNERSVYLNPSHHVVIQLLSTFQGAQLKIRDYGGALKSATMLTRAYELTLPPYFPVVGLSYAIVAKVKHFLNENVVSTIRENQRQQRQQLQRGAERDKMRHLCDTHIHSIHKVIQNGLKSVNILQITEGTDGIFVNQVKAIVEEAKMELKATQQWRDSL